MNHNIAMQHLPLTMWTGATPAVPSRMRDISTHVYFGFAAEVKTAITTDAVFTVIAADGTDANVCIPDTAFDVDAVPLCSSPAFAGTDAGVEQIVIPAGTPAGTICAMSIPCRPGRYIGVRAVSGDTAKIDINLVLSGPRR